MRVNIVYELNNREFNHCVLLQREMIRRGYDARIYNKTESMVLSNKESITIIPNSYRKGDVDYYRYVFNTRNHLVVVYPCEQINNHQLPEFFDHSPGNPVKKLPHLCWGDDYYHFIQSLGYDMTYSKITGAMHLDFCRKEFRSLFCSRSELGERFHIPAEKKWILFISDFVHGSRVMTAQLIKSGDAKKNILMAKHELEKKTCREILNWFARFLDGHEDYIVIYRKHPAEMITEETLDVIKRYEGRMYAISDLSIKEWIFNCDHIATWYSTAVVECFAADRKIMLLRPYGFTEESKMKEYSFYREFHKIRDYQDFETVVLNGGCEYPQDTIHKICGLYCTEEKPSFQKVADAIEQIASEWKIGEQERWFFCKRWFYCLRKFLPLKIVIKKLYQLLYVRLGIDLSSQSDSRYAVLELKASADNKGKVKELCVQIDEILNAQFPI